MSATLIGIIGILILLAVLFFLGMPVGFAMGIVGFCGFWYVVSFKAASKRGGGRYLGHFLKIRFDSHTPFHLLRIPCIQFGYC